jgi:hypothetical protein
LTHRGEDLEPTLFGAPPQVASGFIAFETIQKWTVA